MPPTRPLVLIADDDPHLVELLGRRAHEMGLAVETACDGPSLARALDLRAPQLVILDVGMPGTDGLDVCQMLARDEATQQIPVIILTGRSDEQVIRRCHELLAFYVPKCADVWRRVEPLIVELLGDRWPLAKARDAASLASMATATAAVAIDRAPSSQPASAGHADERAGPRPCILCIDDDGEFSWSLKLRFEEHGWDVVRAFAGADGLRESLTAGPAAILLDYEMEHGNGEYVLRRLKESCLTSTIPVLVITGVKDKSLERRMYRLGALRVFHKPVRWRELWHELRHLLPRTAITPTDARA